MEQNSGYGSCYGNCRSKDYGNQADRDTGQGKQVHSHKRLLPDMFRSIIGKAKDFLQNLIREQDMPPKPTLNINMTEFRIMQQLMIRVQDSAKEIKHLQNRVLPKLKQELKDTAGLFKGKERKHLREDTADRGRNLRKVGQAPRYSERGRLSRCSGIYGNLP